jgi:hypothetical protein
VAVRFEKKSPLGLNGDRILPGRRSGCAQQSVITLNYDKFEKENGCLHPDQSGWSASQVGDWDRVESSRHNGECFPHLDWTETLEHRIEN